MLSAEKRPHSRGTLPNDGAHGRGDGRDARDHAHGSARGPGEGGRGLDDRRGARAVFPSAYRR